MERKLGLKERKELALIAFPGWLTASRLSQGKGYGSIDSPPLSSKKRAKG